MYKETNNVWTNDMPSKSPFLAVLGSELQRGQFGKIRLKTRNTKCNIFIIEVNETQA